MAIRKAIFEWSEIQSLEQTKLKRSADTDRLNLVHAGTRSSNRFIAAKHIVKYIWAMDDYLEINRHVYDATAEEFLHKQPQRQDSTKRLVNFFLSYLLPTTSLSLLELGAGTGTASALLSEAGHDVAAIEFSPKMAEVARISAPKVRVIVDEFLRHDFANETFNGIYAVAFIHLFPSDDALNVVRKVKSLLKPDGIALFSTTLHPKTSEGFLAKVNFKSEEKRFRKQYDEQELKKLVTEAGLQVVEFQKIQDPEEAEKFWANVIVRKTD